MQIAYDLAGLKALATPAAPAAEAAHAVTIGNFDGVHLGHRRLLQRTREKAAATGAFSAAVTFDPHPLRVISGVHLPDLLTPLPRKLELLADSGIDLALVLHFTPAMAALAPQEFVRSVLLEGLRLTDLVIGYDYALGKGRAGDFTMLSGLGRDWGFSVEQLDPVLVDGETVSSSLIRERIRQGAVDRVRPLLCRLHAVDGEVIRGQERGRTLGFPTANLLLGDALIPPPGVYATWTEILPQGGAAKSAPLAGVTSVGTNPTFGGTSLSLETHLFDFHGDLYGKTLRLHFAGRLRDQERFADVRALKRQIETDAQNARVYLARPAAGL